MKIKIKISKNADKEQSSSAQIVASNYDLLTEILRRLPIKSLIRFELVSKHWQSIITSQVFILLRNPNPNPAVGLFLPSGVYEPNPLFEYVPFSVKEPTTPPFTRLNFVKDPPLTEIWHSCNGLFLCRTTWRAVDGVRRYYVFNPSTKKNFNLPEFQGVGNESWISIHGMRLAFDPTKSPHYKVVIVWGTETEGGVGPFEYQFEVYSSETGLWRMCYKPFKGITHFDGGVYWNDAINWCSFWTGEFLYFNLADEVLEEMPMPPFPDGWDIRTHSRKLYFGESCDHLHFVGIFGPEIQFNVYEMKRDYSEWFVKYKVDLSPVIAANPGMILDHYDPTHAYYYGYTIFTLVRGEKEEDSFLVLQIPGKAMRYNIVDKTFEIVYEFEGDEDQDYLKFEGMNGFQYIESLCSV